MNGAEAYCILECMTGYGTAPARPPTMHSFFLSVGAKLGSVMPLLDTMMFTNKAEYLLSFALSSMVAWLPAAALIVRRSLPSFVRMQPLLAGVLVPHHRALCAAECSSRPLAAEAFGHVVRALRSSVTPAVAMLGTAPSSDLEAASNSADSKTGCDCFKVILFATLFFCYALPGLACYLLEQRERSAAARLARQRGTTPPPHLSLLWLLPLLTAAASWVVLDVLL